VYSSWPPLETHPPHQLRDDINTTLRRIHASLYGVDPEERKKLAENLRAALSASMNWWNSGEVVAEIKTIAVIGAGTMGRGFPCCGSRGYRTVLEDLLPAALRKAENEIRQSRQSRRTQESFSRGYASRFSSVGIAGGIEEAAREADL